MYMMKLTETRDFRIVSEYITDKKTACVQLLQIVDNPLTNCKVQNFSLL